MTGPRRDGRLRPGGLVLFAAVLVLLVGGWVLLAGTLVRHAVEAAGTALVGARVDLGGADVGLFPPSITLSGLAVTDPDAPMTNAVEVARGAFALEGRPLLTGRVVVRTARLDGVRLGTPRAVSGAISRAPKAKKEGGGLSLPLPALSLPDPAAILKENPLTSVADAEALARDLKAARAAWEERVAGLPGEDDVAAYRKRIRALRDAKPRGVDEILAAGKDAARLKRDIGGDLKRLREARADLGEDLKTYRERARKVAEAPVAEARALADRYAGEGLSGVGAFFLKPQVEGAVRRAFGWYRRLEPIVAGAARRAGRARVSRPPRGRGEVVRFPEAHPLPSFLIREAAVDVTVEGGTVAGNVRNVTTEPEVLGQPLAWGFLGTGLGAMDQVRIEGFLDRVDPARPRGRLRAAFTGVGVRDRALARGGPVPVTLAEGKADLTADVTQEGPGALRGSVDVALTGARFALGETRDPVAAAVADAIRGVSRATVHADISGPPDAPEVRVRSDLDRVVGDALKAAAGARVKALGADLEAAIRARAAGPLEDARAAVAQLDGPLGAALGGHEDALDGLVREAEAAVGKGLKLPF